MPIFPLPVVSRPAVSPPAVSPPSAAAPSRAPRFAALLAAAVLPLTLAACTNNNAVAEAGPIKVSSTNDACTLSSQAAKSGNLTFTIQNDGSQVTEFYLLADDGLRILGEVENIGPGLTRNLVVTRTRPGSTRRRASPACRATEFAPPSRSLNPARSRSVTRI